jgi:hypothetical protein
VRLRGDARKQMEWEVDELQRKGREAAAKLKGR